MAKENEYILLLQVASHIEANVIVSLLKSEGVDCFDESSPIGGYTEIYMGSSTYGRDIYVLSSDFDKAKEILDIDITKEL